MFKKLKPILIYEWSRKFIFFLLATYAVLCTLMILKMKPNTILIGIDPYGTRVIETKDDRLIRIERHNFVKKFLSTLYNYDSETFSKVISLAGDLMIRELWEKRQPEFIQILEDLKLKPVTQKMEIEDLRELDPATYQADIKLTIKRSLLEKQVRLRLDLRLTPSSRTTVNPYPYEVISYDEQIF